MWSNIQTQIFSYLGTSSTADMDFFDTMLYLIGQYGPSYMRGAGNTLLIAVVSTIIGCIIGLGVGIIQTIPLGAKDTMLKKVVVKLCRILMAVYVEVFRGTPMMVQATFIYFGIPMLFGTYLPAWPTAFLVVSINTGAYMAETVRGGILSIDPGQTEGAKAIGMNHVQTMLYIMLPQTLRNIMPQIGNNLIINVKDTCVLSAISVSELYLSHTKVAGAEYTFFESATILMAIYLTMTLILSRLLRWVEKKMDGDDSYDLATTDTLAHTTGLYSYPKKGSNFDERHAESGTAEPKPEDIKAKKESKKHRRDGE